MGKRGYRLMGMWLDDADLPAEFNEDEYVLVELNGKPRYVARGRCGIRADHMPHLHHDYDIGPFWCHASMHVPTI